MSDPCPTQPLPVQAQTLLERHLGPLPEALQTCAGQAQALHLAPGQVLLGAGQRWERLWLVQQGCLRLYYLDREGRASNKNFFLPGSLLWPITPALREQSIHAAEGHPPWLHLQQHTLAALLQDKMERERQFLQLTATERYQRLCQTHPEWLDVLPLRHLASWLGITDVALSRIRRRLGY